MYKRFSKNMQEFLKLNKPKDGEKNYRYDIVNSMKALSDIDEYIKLKESNYRKYKELSNIIWEMENSIDKYPAFKVLCWEMWGYNLDKEKAEVEDKEKLREQLKILDLLLSTKYWN